MGGCTIFKRTLTTLAVVGGGLTALIAHSAEMPQLEFSLRPNLCVLSADEDACYDELEVRWRAPKNMSLCLYQSDLEEPLRCWQEVSEGEHRFLISATHDVTFQLRENRNLLVSEAFEVVQDKKEYRRQRRNPWSFF